MNDDDDDNDYNDVMYRYYTNWLYMYQYIYCINIVYIYINTAEMNYRYIHWPSLTYFLVMLNRFEMVFLVLACRTNCGLQR